MAVAMGIALAHGVISLTGGLSIVNDLSKCPCSGQPVDMVANDAPIFCYERPNSQAKFGVRTEADQAQSVGIRLLVDQHQIGFDVAVSMIVPIAAQRVIAVVRLERKVGNEQIKHV